MAKQTHSAKISKYAKKLEAQKKQLEESAQKIKSIEDELAIELGSLALSFKLEQIPMEKLKAGFSKLAKEHNLS